MAVLHENPGLPPLIKCRSNAKSWYDEHVHDVYDI